MSTKLKKLQIPTHYLITRARGLRAPSIVELEQIKTIDKMRIIDYIGKVSPEQMRGIEQATQISLGLYIPESVEAP